ncbi:MAG: pyruvate dehydrogenase (acetyl-transferring) E1 component subunit alpha [Phycisphaerales bacterium]|nr:pyruvate dehydrogenase (acetyl-transferring) E1 component subunit alpha [Phycisphaerales bacterium]
MPTTTTQTRAGNNRAKGLAAKLPDKTLHGWLRDLLLMREFELRTMAAYQQAKIGGFCHVYNGQEACALGTIRSVEPDDPVITAYRDHGHALARGMDPKFCMAEMFGKVTGCAKGKGGSMHMFDKPNWLFGGHGIVSAQTPVGAGLAFAARYEWEVLKKGLDGGKAKKKVCLCYLGDGALNQGALHEAMNLAGLLSIPVIYIVENNGYSMGTAIHRGTTMAKDLGRKAAAYGIEYLEFDGMDMMDVYDNFKPFADVLRDEQRPGFVNLKTYRYQGHSMSDPQKYREKDEVLTYQERDPIVTLSDYLLNERESLTDEQYKDMQKDVKAQVRAAVEYAEESPEPDLSELYSDVYVNREKNLSPLGPDVYVEGAGNALLEGN